MPSNTRPDSARTQSVRKPTSTDQDRSSGPKKRWTPAERLERGHDPRRSGGKPRSRPSFAPYEVESDPKANRSRPARASRAPFDRSRSDRAPYDRALARRPAPLETSPSDTELGPDVSTHSADQPTTTFAALGLPKALVAALAGQGIVAPFAIQTTTIPDALAGRDVLGRAQTGSGKTLAFGLPLLARLAGSPTHTPRAMILTPTRELATQVADVLTPLARTVGLSTVLVAGGMSYTPQTKAFDRGVDIVIATPGRLIDLLEQGVANLSRVEVAVIDEADHMADLGFMPAVTTLMDAVPVGGQRLLFSATLDRAVDQLVRSYLSSPVTHRIEAASGSVVGSEHHLLLVHPHHKVEVTAEIASRPGRTLIFVRTQLGAERVADQLRSRGVLAGALHGGLTQGARNRVLSVFKDGILPVLVATDVAARGIHVDDVGLVLQVDPAAGAKDYLHRAGRTARAGATGVVVTLALPHQRREVTRLAREAAIGTSPITVEPGQEQLAQITGARTPSAPAVSQSAYEELIAPPRKGGKRSWPGSDKGPRRSRPYGPADSRSGSSDRGAYGSRRSDKGHSRRSSERAR